MVIDRIRRFTAIPTVIPEVTVIEEQITGFLAPI